MERTKGIATLVVPGTFSVISQRYKQQVSLDNSLDNTKEVGIALPTRMSQWAVYQMDSSEKCPKLHSQTTWKEVPS